MIRVLGSRIVVAVEADDKPKSSLIIVQDNKEPKCEGKVVSVGKGTRLQDGTLIPVDVAVGDHVLYSRMAGVPLKYENQEFLVINERDVIGIVD